MSSSQAVSLATYFPSSIRRDSFNLNWDSLISAVATRNMIRLGKGAKGSVVLYQEGEEKYAIKFIKVLEESEKSSKSLEHLKNEEKLAVTLSHPNIIQTYGSCQFTGFDCIVTEYVEGIDLEALLKNIDIKETK